MLRPFARPALSKGTSPLVRLPDVPLKQATTLDDLQSYVAEMEEERGFSNRDVGQQCLLLGEEVGELFKAVRKHKKMRIGTTSVTGTVDEELGVKWWVHPLTPSPVSRGATISGDLAGHHRMIPVQQSPDPPTRKFGGKLSKDDFSLLGENLHTTHR